MRSLGLFLVVLALAGCDFADAPARPDRTTPQASAPDIAFTHSQTEDISGSYRASGVSMGDVTLTQVFVGQTQDFEAWEAGRRTVAFAPVMAEFTHGAETVRVMPERYAVSDGRVSMRGTAPEIGQVSVDLRLDKGALATARRNLGGAEDPAMTGSVRVGDRSGSGVKLNWYGGD